MLMKRLGMFLLAALVLIGSAYAQNEPVKPKTISGGVLNGKAVSLPKPPYPPAARAVNAEGAVSVQVLIDEQGSVISATAVSGHPLLRAAAMEAAKGAVFSPTLLQGSPVKVSGIITYNFVGVVTTGGIGFELAFAERAGEFYKYVSNRSLAARLPEEWVEDRVLLNGLTFEKQPVRTELPPVAAERNPDKFTAFGPAESGNPYDGGKLTPASLEDVRRLQSSIRSKLAGDAKAEWHFRVGTSLGHFAAEIADSNKTTFNIAEIDHFIGTAPSGTNPNLLTALTKLAELAKTSEGSPEARQQLVTAAQGVKNIRP